MVQMVVEKLPGPLLTFSELCKISDDVLAERVGTTRISEAPLS